MVTVFLFYAFYGLHILNWHVDVVTYLAHKRHLKFAHVLMQSDSTISLLLVANKLLRTFLFSAAAIVTLSVELADLSAELPLPHVYHRPALLVKGNN